VSLDRLSEGETGPWGVEWGRCPGSLCVQGGGVEWSLYGIWLAGGAGIRTTCYRKFRGRGK